MRVLNMCLVLKLDNDKVVSIAHEKTDGQTEPPICTLQLDEKISGSSKKYSCIFSTEKKVKVIHIFQFE